MADRRRRRRLDNSETAGGSEGEEGRVVTSEDALSQSGDESDTILDQEEDSEYESAEENQDTSSSKHKHSSRRTTDSTDTTPSRVTTTDDYETDREQRTQDTKRRDDDESVDNKSMVDDGDDVVIEEDYIEGEEEGQFEDGEEDEQAEEERGSGDGEEKEKNLDADEDDKNPAYIPRKGAFFMHDMRSDEGKGPTPRREKKLWQDTGKKWGHDMFMEMEQAPKPREELMVMYGYDVRRDNAPPARGRGRGYRGRRTDREFSEGDYRARKERATINDFISSGSERRPPSPTERGRGRRPRGRGRWSQPQDPERPHRTDWSSNKIDIQNEDDNNTEIKNSQLNAQELNRQGYSSRMQEERREFTDRGSSYGDKPEREYGRNRRNYNVRNNRPECDHSGKGDWDKPRGNQPVRDQVSPSSYQRDTVHQPDSWAKENVVEKESLENDEQEVYKASEGLIIESRTVKKVEAESKGELIKPRETKSYSRERHQRSLKQENLTVHGEQDIAVTTGAVTEQSKENLEKQLQALRITVKGSERRAELITDEEMRIGKTESTNGIHPQPADAVVHTPSAVGDGPMGDKREQSGRPKRYSSQRQRSAVDTSTQRPAMDQPPPQFYEQGFQGHVYHPGSTPPTTISAPPPHNMAGTPPHTIPPNTPPHNVMTTPPPPQQGPSVVHRHSPGPTSTVPHMHTVPPPAIITTAILPPGIPRHPMGHGDTQAMLHQGIIVRPEVGMHPGMQHPSPTHMVSNAPQPLMHPNPNLPAQQLPLRPSFPPPQFVPGGVMNYGQPPGPHYQIGGPVAIQHYPAVSTISGQPPPTIPVQAQAISAQPPPVLPGRPPPIPPPTQHLPPPPPQHLPPPPAQHLPPPPAQHIPPPPAQHLPPPPAGAPPTGPSQMYSGITYYSPEQQLGIKRLPPKRQANPIRIEEPPQRLPDIYDQQQQFTEAQLQQYTEAQLQQYTEAQQQQYTEAQHQQYLLYQQQQLAQQAPPQQVEVPQAHLQQLAQAQQQQQAVQIQQQQQHTVSQQPAQPSPEADESASVEAKQD